MGPRCPTGSGVRAAPARPPLALGGTTNPDSPRAPSPAPPRGALHAGKRVPPSAHHRSARPPAGLPFPACPAAAAAPRLPVSAGRLRARAGPGPPRTGAGLAPFRWLRPGPGRSADPASRRGGAEPRQGWRAAQGLSGAAGTAMAAREGGPEAVGGKRLHGDRCKQRGWCGPWRRAALRPAGKGRAGGGRGSRRPISGATGRPSLPAGLRCLPGPATPNGPATRPVPPRPEPASGPSEGGGTRFPTPARLEVSINSGEGLLDCSGDGRARRSWNKGQTRSQRSEGLAERFLWYLLCRCYWL